MSKRIGSHALSPFRLSAPTPPSSPAYPATGGAGERGPGQPLVAALLTLFLLLQALPAWAETIPLFCPKGFDAGPLLQTLKAASSLEVVPRESPPETPACPPLALAVGGDAAERLLADCPATRVVTTHTSRAELARLRQRHGAARLTGVYLEAHPATQLRLLKEAAARARRVGLLHSSWFRPQLGEVRAEAGRLGLTLVEAEVPEGVHPARILHDILPEVDAVLMPADPTLLGPTTIRPLLLGTARHFVPMFGGRSEAYVEAGIAAGVFATEEGMGRRAAELLHSAQAGQWGDPAYAGEYRITTNRSVARILDVRPITTLAKPSGGVERPPREVLEVP